MSGIELDYRVPAEDLQPYVTLFYHFRADLPVFEDIERADHAQIRFRLSGGAGHYEFADGARHDSPPLHVVGPTCGAMRTWAEGPVEVIGMGVQPAGWAAMIGVDASTMVNRAVEGSVLLGRAMADAAVAMRAADGTDAKVAAAEAFVRGLVAGGAARLLGFARAIDAWLAGSASPDLDALVATTGLSRRQVERRCNALYGAPPKLLARKYRALRAAVALASGSATLDALIADGFYDQSHLIREMKQFTGLTPRQMREHPTALSQLTITQRRALDGQVHRIITET